MKHLFLVLTFCCCGIFAFSQTDTLNYRYSLFGIGVKQHKVSYLSPLYYTGLSFVGASGKVTALPNRMKTSASDVNFDVLGTLNSNNSMFTLGVNYIFNNHYLLSFKNERYGTIFPKAFIGWGFWNDTEFDFKTTNTNNPFYFKIGNMACVTFALEKKLKKIYIFNEFNLPLIGIYAGTEYSSLLPYFAIEEDEKETNPLSMFDILFISQNTQLQNRFNIDFKIKSKTIRVQYALGYKKLHLNNNTVHSASHIFKIGYLFNKTPYVHK